MKNLNAKYLLAGMLFFQLSRANGEDADILLTQLPSVLLPSKYSSSGPDRRSSNLLQRSDKKCKAGFCEKIMSNSNELDRFKFPIDEIETMTGSKLSFSRIGAFIRPKILVRTVPLRPFVRRLQMNLLSDLILVIAGPEDEVKTEESINQILWGVEHTAWVDNDLVLTTKGSIILYRPEITEHTKWECNSSVLGQACNAFGLGGFEYSLMKVYGLKENIDFNYEIRVRTNLTAKNFSVSINVGDITSSPGLQQYASSIVSNLGKTISESLEPVAHDIENALNATLANIITEYTSNANQGAVQVAWKLVGFNFARFTPPPYVDNVTFGTGDTKIFKMKADSYPCSELLDDAPGGGAQAARVINAAALPILNSDNVDVGYEDFSVDLLFEADVVRPSIARTLQHLAVEKQPQLKKWLAEANNACEYLINNKPFPARPCDLSDAQPIPSTGCPVDLSSQF